MASFPGAKLWGNHAILVVGLLSLALILQIGLLASLSSGWYMGDPEWWDISGHLAHEGTYSFDGETATRMRPPGYIAFLSALRLLVGDSVRRVQISQILLNTGTLFLIYAAAKSTFSKNAGIFALVAATFTVPLLMLSVRIYSEVLFIPLLVTTALLVGAFYRSPSTRRRIAIALLLGLVVGMLAQTRIVALGVPILVAGFLAYPIYKTQWPSLRRYVILSAVLACFSLVVVVTLLPWTIYTRQVLNAPPPQLRLA